MARYNDMLNSNKWKKKHASRYEVPIKVIENVRKGQGCTQAQVGTRNGFVQMPSYLFFPFGPIILTGTTGHGLCSRGRNCV